MKRGDIPLKMSELKKSIKEFWNEYKNYKSGIVGLVLLIILASVAVGASLITSVEDYNNWYNPSYWRENPVDAPPVWVNFFTSKKLPVHQVEFVSVEDFKYVEGEPTEGLRTYSVNIIYEFKYDVEPSDIIIRILGAVAEGKNASITITVIRPDGHRINVYKAVSTFPELVGNYSAKTVSFSRTSKAGSAIIKWASQFESEENIREVSGYPPHGDWVIRVLFSKAEVGILVGEAELLRGEYQFSISVTFFDEESMLYGVKLIIAGSVYGWMGTDSLGRDLFVGIVWGCRLALIIGVLTSVISTFVGVFYGVLSAYKGGLVDELMQRIYEIVASMPLFPILLILSWKFGATVWNLALLMALFWWTGPVKTVRSMALQIKEETYVEAAKAMGAGTWRIVTKYIIGQIIPYAFAIMALNVPGAILTEAGISFLLGGRGTREPTWGRILHDAAAAGATLKGLWWWVILPGVMITITGLTFVLIGSALDKILNPMLKR